MAELSAESGMPVATIKYYLREGLLHPGERTSPNQARYGREHVQRLKLVRAMLDLGGLSVAAAREVLAAVDAGEPTYQVLGLTQSALVAGSAEVDDESRTWALGVLNALADKHGWQFGPDSPSALSVISTLAALRALGHDAMLDRLEDYATIADRTAVIDLDTVAAEPSLEGIVQGAVIGIVLGDRLSAGLRHLAQAAESGRRYPEGLP